MSLSTTLALRTVQCRWRWAHSTLLSELKAGPLYNGQPPYGYRGYAGDKVQRVLGHAVVRQVAEWADLVTLCINTVQVRSRRNTCRVAPEVANLTRECR